MMRSVQRRRGRPPHPDVLTPSEWRVVNAIRHGMSNREISRRLHVSLDAVKFHVENALGKLALKTRVELKHWPGVASDSPLRRRGPMTTLQPTLGPIGQISRQVRDIPQAVAWYKDVLGLPHLFTYGDLAFFDCGGTRLFLTSRQGEDDAGNSILYFRTADINANYRDLTERGVTFRGAPHMIHRHDSGVEEWMAFFEKISTVTCWRSCRR